MTVLQADYEGLKVNANSLTTSSEGLRQRKGEIVRLADEVRGGAWQGESANAYLAKTETLISAIEKLEGALDAHREIAMHIVSILEEADVTAAAVLARN